MPTEQEIQQNIVARGRTFVWHEITAPDIQKSIDFYSNALGFGVQEFPMGEMGTYHMLTRDGQAIAGVTSPQMPGTPSHWATYIAVENVDNSVARCQEHGATLLAPAFDVPTVGRMALLQDPQGAAFWIFTPQM